MNDPRQQLFDFLDHSASSGVFPGAVAAVWRNGAWLYDEAHGVLATDAATSVAGIPAARDTIYDVASLTKVLCTTTLCALAVAQQQLDLGAEVPADLWRPRNGATLGHLLEHSAGLAAHEPLYARGLLGEDLQNAVRDLDAVSAAGDACVYSDLGFIILGRWLERIFDRPLAQLVEDRIAYCLGLDDKSFPALGFREVGSRSWLSPAEEHRIAPTEVYRDRESEPGQNYCRLRMNAGTQVAHGEVHDDNAWALGGSAGHAGLFASAAGVLTVARAWLEASLPGLTPAVRDRFWTPSLVPGSVRRLGFDGVSSGGSTGGALGDHAVGHLGFTGCSLWIDPSRELVAVLLSNHVHPLRNPPNPIKEFRPEFHRLAASLT